MSRPNWQRPRQPHRPRPPHPWVVDDGKPASLQHTFEAAIFNKSSRSIVTCKVRPQKSPSGFCFGFHPRWSDSFVLTNENIARQSHDRRTRCDRYTRRIFYASLKNPVRPCTKRVRGYIYICKGLQREAKNDCPIRVSGMEEKRRDNRQLFDLPYACRLEFPCKAKTGNTISIFTIGRLIGRPKTMPWCVCSVPK